MEQEQKQEDFVIKKIYLVAIIAISLAVIAGAIVYTIATAPHKQNPNSPADVEKLFVKYAGDLGLDMAKFRGCFVAAKDAAIVKADSDKGAAIGVQGTPTFVVNGQIIVGAYPYANFKSILDKELANPVNRTLAFQLIDNNTPTLGNKNAPVVMVEFSDFQCPFCAGFYSQSEKQLIKDYVGTGKVYFAYEHFPLSNIHQFAQDAAEAAQCANDQGKFWQYHNTLFEKQAEWAG